MRCAPDRNCSPLLDEGDNTLASLVRAYRIRNRPGALEEIAFFKGCDSIDKVLHHASLAIDHNSNRYSHQFRLKPGVLRQAKERLTCARQELAKAESFKELHEALKRILRGVAGLGELYYYDTALRIGAYLGLMPVEVYLHRGTRAGAAALGLSSNGETLPVSELPKPIQELEAHEIEDFLCIYKSRFRPT